MRRLATFVVSVALLAGGVFGAWAYGHDYYLYRGFAPPHNPAGVAAGRLISAHLYSPALHAPRSYRVYLPPGYSAGAATGIRFPALYLLHGSPGQPDLYVNAGGLGVALDTLVARHAIKPFVVVMPDGRNASFRSDTEWANTRHGNYEGFVLDVVRAVDQRFATRADRAHRAIAGLSEGAYGAVNMALRHLGTFSVVESWSGYFTQSRTGPFKGAPRGQVRANSPSAYVSSIRASLRRLPLHAFLYGGRGDPGTRPIRTFAARLRAAGGHVTTATYKGTHNWRLWRTAMPVALRYAAAHIGPK